MTTRTTTTATTAGATISPGLTAALSLTARRRRRAAGERIAVLFETHGRMVYGVCRVILRDATEAEDAAQQSFLSAYRGLLAGQEPRDPSAWLGTIARNECRARLRSRSTEPLTLVTEPSADETQREVGRRAEAEALCTALAELPPQQRDAIVLREFYGLSYAEVAAALGLSGPAVEALLYRGRRSLQAQLRPLRAALGMLTLPPSLSESLAQALPGFGGSAAGAGVGAGLLAKVGSTSIAAKLAAATLALGTAGTVAGLERHAHRPVLQRAPAAAKPHRVAAAGLAAETVVPGPAPIAPARRVSFKPARTETRGHREPEHERATASESSGRDSGSDESGSGSGSGSGSSPEGGSSGSEPGSGGADHLDGGTSSGGDGSGGSDGGGSGTSGGGDDHVDDGTSGGGGPGDD